MRSALSLIADLVVIVYLVIGPFRPVVRRVIAWKRDKCRKYGHYSSKGSRSTDDEPFCDRCGLLLHAWGRDRDYSLLDAIIGRR